MKNAELNSIYTENNLPNGGYKDIIVEITLNHFCVGTVPLENNEDGPATGLSMETRWKRLEKVMVLFHYQQIKDFMILHRG